MGACRFSSCRQSVRVNTRLISRRPCPNVTIPVSRHLLWSVVLITSLLATATLADWIDPDTPWEARTTVPLTAKPGPKPTPAPTLPDQVRRKPGQHVKTPAPTKSPAPTVSPRPSHEPSASPSYFPTMDPDRIFELVFSDEFNTPNRTFGDGTDPRWTALDKNDYTNDALHYYTPDNVRTNEEGQLVIVSEAADTDIVGFDDVKLEKTRVTKHFRSGMVQSWNKFCFTGGIIEAEVVLPGKPSVGGLWPAFWLLGNLARHTYVGSSEHIWPWSSLNCTKKSGWAQRISGCDWATHYGRYYRAQWRIGCMGC